MASRIIYNTKLIGISAAVPPLVFSINEYEYMSVEERKKFIDNVGIVQKRHVSVGVTAADLCESAANQLLDQNGINRNDIDALVFVCQTRDHIYPCTSTILQHKLNLPKSCLAFDVPLGCSGYIYGITILTALMESGTIKMGLLLAGDTCTLTASEKDKTFFPLLGDAGTATLFEYDKNASAIYSTLYTDGSGYKDLIMPAGGFREPWDENIIKEKTGFDGIVRKGYHAYIDGLKIFEFTMREVVKNIRETIEMAGVSNNDIDYFILHQANLLINETIRKQLKVEKNKFLNSMQLYGNTGAATIPLTMVTEMQTKLSAQHNKLLLCGFGVGLSWASIVQDVPPIKMFPIVEYKNNCQ